MKIIPGEIKVNKFDFAFRVEMQSISQNEKAQGFLD